MGEDGWPVDLRGITESVVTTRGPEGRYAVAALGLHAGDPVTARTWGSTRTRRNLERTGEAHLQFTRDPVTFVDAALAARSVEEPVLPEADAWVRVAVERVDEGTSGGTDWVDWALSPGASSVEREAVPAVNRGYNAVVEATVAASRLGVDAYEQEPLRRRLAHLEGVARRCGGDREREAFDRLNEIVGR